MRPTPRVAVLVVVVLLVSSACVSTGSSEPAPAMTPGLSAQLQAGAFARACRDVICAGAPIYAPASTSPAVREAILEQFGNEVEYVEQSQLDRLYTSNDRFANGATMIGVGTVDATRRSDVVGVDVWISRGQYDFVGRTYLFLWNGAQWVDTSPDAVDVTVTSSVS